MGFIRVDNLGNIITYSDEPIDGSISLNDDALCQQIKEDTVNHKFLNDTIVYIPRTTPYQTWNGITWVHSNQLMEAAKLEMWEKIKIYRDKHKYKGVKINVSGTYYWIHSDEASRIQHLGLLGAAILHVFRVFFGITQFEEFSTDLMWKTMESTELGEPVWVLMTWIVALQIFAADMKMEAACFAKAEYHRQLMMLSTDPYNYDYTTGWPQVFGG